jgi:two-component system, NtrC family, nitrogen regulation response regulator GlnG
MQHTVLLADDDKAICLVLNQALAERGYEVQTVGTASALLKLVESGLGDIVITDVMMPGGSGLDILPAIKHIRPHLPVIVISAQNTLLTAVKANELGAFDYLAKPFDLNELLHTLEKALAGSNVKKPAAQTDAQEAALPLIGRSGAMQDIYKVIARLIPVDLTVLIEGESGTGKEVVARTLHDLGPRRNGPFVAINMAAIPRELVESELFGHEKGSFTGATARKAGKFEQAKGGTLFLDEIGDMPPEAQSKLLRVLQQGEYVSVGGTRPIGTDVRIVCATHRDLKKLITTGHFREDLFYRLNVVPLRLPPLRQRREDVPELCQYFFRKAQQKGMAEKHLDEAAQKLLMDYDWPGNVRELENLIYRLCALYADKEISPSVVRQELERAGAEQSQGDSNAQTLDQLVREHISRYFLLHDGDEESGLYDRMMQIIEKPLIEQVLEQTRGNQVKAAQILGINRNTLRKKIGELGIAADESKQIRIIKSGS